MEKFIPYEKLSKKKRRALNAKHREVWPISPITRKPENPKAYNRKKAQRRDFDDTRSVPFLFYFFQFEQPDFFLQASGISRQTSVHPDNPVTGDHQRNCIMGNRSSDGLC